jgi:hypothetical protein
VHSPHGTVATSAMGANLAPGGGGVVPQVGVAPRGEEEAALLAARAYAIPRSLFLCAPPIHCFSGAAGAMA